MKNIKITLISVVIFGMFSVCLLPLVVGAQPLPTPIKSTDDIIRTLNNIKDIIGTILGVVVVIIFIWAGVTFVTAEGDPTKLEKAKNRVLYGIIGIIVALLAGGILLLIQNVMT